jgi:hypothetical protein
VGYDGEVDMRVFDLPFWLFLHIYSFPFPGEDSKGLFIESGPTGRALYLMIGKILV